jgi:hypothetical protein
VDAIGNPGSREARSWEYSHSIDRNKDKQIGGGNSVNCSSKGHLYTTSQSKPLQYGKEAIVFPIRGFQEWEADEGEDLLLLWTLCSAR